MITFRVAGVLRVAHQDTILVQIVPPQQRDFLLPSRRKQSECDNFLHWYRGGAMIADAPEVLHKSIDLIQGRAAIALVTFRIRPNFLRTVTASSNSCRDSG